MANQANPNGFQPRQMTTGANYNGAGRTYYIPSSDGNQYYVGDPVLTAAGGADVNGIPQVVRAAAGNTCRGVITAVYASPPLQATTMQGPPLALEQTYIPATKLKNYYVMVADDPNTVFEIQDDGLTPANLVAAAIGQNANFTINNPANPLQSSAVVLNSSTIATTNTLPLKILGLVQLPNNAFGAYARWLVRFNTHELAFNTTGV